MDRIIDMLIAVAVPTIVYLIQDKIKDRKHKQEMVEQEKKRKQEMIEQERKRKQEIIEQIDQKQNEEIKVLRDGIKALLHDRIIQKCEYHLRQKHISASDIQELEYMNEPYKALGGNGTVKTMLSAVHKLDKETNK